MRYAFLSICILMVTAFNITTEAQTNTFPADTCNKTSVNEKLNESISTAASSGDSLHIHRKGTSNTIMINSSSIVSPGTKVTINGKVVGEINQLGESNKIKFDTTNTSGQKVKINQTGKNNSVTIRSGAIQGEP